MTESNVKSVKCKQEGCTAAIDGKCLEGLTLDSCPHCTIVEDDITYEIVESDVVENDAITDEEIFHEVHLGEALEIGETNIITNSSKTRLILLVGLSDAGKTTMLASIFDLFQSQSNFSGYSFAGSKTLIGFERRCHHARIKSERDIPETERTKSSDSRVFLHLKVNKENTSTNLLFTDISGEIFKELNNSTIESKNFELAKRADHFALFIDSDQLSDFVKRNVAKTRSIGILSSLIEANMLGVHTFIEVIFSRWDLLNSKTNIETHTKFVNSLKDEIIRKFSSTHCNIAFYNLASRPESMFPFGYGIAEIFCDWVEKTPLTYNTMEYDSIKTICIPLREFSRYSHK